VQTGYQTIPKERATGSFNFIDNKTLNLQTGMNIIDRLESVSNAVLFDKSTSRPAVTIRGISSIVGNKDPLIIQYNFPYEGSIDNINTTDIESVTILKDAAAASIWGTRAGNGVIVLTSKKGRFQQPLKIEWSSNLSVQDKPDLFYLPRISSASFVELEQFLFSKGYFLNKEKDNLKPFLSPVIETLIAERDGRITSNEAAAAINAFKQYDLRKDYASLYSYGFTQNHALTLRGGSDKNSYIFSAGFDRNLSDLKANNNRYSLRAENIFKLHKRLRLETGLTGVQSSSISGQKSYELFRIGTAVPVPYTRLFDDEGNEQPLYFYRQTYIDTAGQGKLLDWKYYPVSDHIYNTNKNISYSMLAKAGMQYQVFNSLSLQFTYQFQLQKQDGKDWQGIESYVTRDLVNRFSQIDRQTGIVSYKVPKADVVDFSNGSLQAHNLRGQFNLNKNCSDHSINCIGGMELRSILNQSNAFRVYGYDENVLSYSNVDFVNPYPSFVTGFNSYIPSNLDISATTSRFVSVFLNGAYSYLDRYQLSFSGRRDASNNFGVNTNRKWTPLWSAGLGWEISNEGFYHTPLLPFLKLRATYGYNGNVALDRTAVTTMAYYGSSLYANLPYGRLISFSNPELRWEKVKTINLGIDFRWKGEKVFGSLEFYSKDGLDLFGNSPVDYTTGVGYSIMKNVANMKGRGIDLELHYKTAASKLGWESVLLFSYNSSKVTKYFPATTVGPNFLSDGNSITALEGKPVYGVLSYRWGGLDSAGNPRGYIGSELSTDYATIGSAKTLVSDLVFSGSSTPKMFGSFQNSLMIGNFMLTANLSYKLGHYFRKESVRYGLLINSGRAHGDYDLRWKKPGDEARTTVPSFVYPVTNTRDDYYNSSAVLALKADHLRLQFINLSYRIHQFKPFSLFEIYLNAANLGIIWKANKDGIDPDYPRNIPTPKQLSFGLKTSF
jgi:TonB-linked SusC/RagA family outer membrane protein